MLAAKSLLPYRGLCDFLFNFIIYLFIYFLLLINKKYILIDAKGFKRKSDLQILLIYSTVTCHIKQQYSGHIFEWSGLYQPTAITQHFAEDIIFCD